MPDSSGMPTYAQAMLYCVYVLFAVYLLTRFGRVISASRALPVWVVLMALGVVVVRPELLLPVAALFGIQLVSNLVFATMILFLLFESLTSAAENTRSQRQLRVLVAKLAARDLASQAVAGSPGRALVVVPAFNEADSIVEVVTQLGKLRSASNEAFDALIIDDGSTDHTANLAAQRAGQGVFVVSHAVNSGVGGVLITGFIIALERGYDYVVQCDADGQHPVGMIPELLNIANEQRVDVLVGSRFCEANVADESTTLLRRIGGRVIALVLATFGGNARVTDPTSGFRVYSRRAFPLLAQRMPDEYPEPESIALCAIYGLSIKEAPVRMQARQGGQSSLSGWKSVIFMVKVLTSLLSFRLRFALGRS